MQGQSPGQIGPWGLVPPPPFHPCVLGFGPRATASFPPICTYWNWASSCLSSACWDQAPDAVSRAWDSPWVWKFGRKFGTVSPSSYLQNHGEPWRPDNTAPWTKSSLQANGMNKSFFIKLGKPFSSLHCLISPPPFSSLT